MVSSHAFKTLGYLRSNPFVSFGKSFQQDSISFASPPVLLEGVALTVSADMVSNKFSEAVQVIIQSACHSLHGLHCLSTEKVIYMTGFFITCGTPFLDFL